MKKPWLKHVAKGNPTEIHIPEMSLNQLFCQSSEKYHNHIAVTFYNRTFTYSELAGAIKKIAVELYKLGTDKGDKVAIMLPNCPEYPMIYYAALSLGAVIVQINPMYKSLELLHVLKDSQTKILFVLEDLLPIVQDIVGETFISEIIPVSAENKNRFQRMLNESDGYVPNVEINPKEDVAVLQYTGGTTGRAKGAMLTHYNLVANTLQCVSTSLIKTRLGEERVLSISPLFHVYGMTSAMNCTFYTGGNLILVPRFQVDEVVNLIEKTKPTSFPGVPTMYIALLNYYHTHPFDLSCFTTCTSGSAPLPVEVINRFNEISGTSVAEGYGLSEASPVTHRNPVAGLQKRGSIGIPLPNTDAKIVDIATGTVELPSGEVGELVINGPQIMKGYWQMPHETARTIRDGWLFTGDLAIMDTDGFFYIVGRKKEMILASGYNVYPIEVEDILYSHPNVLEAAVIGIPDEYRGETVKAFVVLREVNKAYEEELIQFCRHRLSAYKVPNSIDFVDELPKTAVGKILKRKLKELYSPENRN
ncbi:long-chain-fatty-acid--CoA ligase [Heyndrickxia acidicola]|uniref:Long-chain fatty acid--CoA ligase n=1 Tax=Heyndrickxia acidicola TaxID=209389 RepID=A0ABU6MAI0_9BACI|nr:long-chain fatty acid--CoA ligase [Heyndrickxia acidicola]MED1201670.1 long-chain fatty acid--CoA ligase [Heyndrickxia acidicola]